MRSACAVVLAACLAGPRYEPPPAPAPHATSYKHGWKLASPADAIPRGPWWTMFHDPELDGLEARVGVDNQTVLQAIASYDAAHAQVRAAIASYFPTVTAAPSALAFRTSASGAAVTAAGATTSGSHALYVLPLQVAWQPDLFGRVRYTVRENQYAAQVSAADLENTRLLVQALVAQTFFQLRGQDALIDLLASTVTADEEVVELTRARFRAGLAQEVAVVQAEQTLQVARVQAANARILRDTLENALATLVGVSATDFKLPHRALLATPPAIPLGAPSQLLERRPDIAEAERAMAAANAAIGLARTAYFPLVSLTGTGCSQQDTACVGFTSSAISTLLDWPNRVWAIGVTAAEVLFDGGARRANVQLSEARYRGAIAAYRQTVLAAFQQIEDALAQARGVADEIDKQRIAVSLAERAYALELDRFQKGLDPYIDLALQQTALLAARQTLVTFEIQQMTASIGLVQALGGGWSRAELPPS
jgi:NodT family efflux transporter outer membrane factor (OMF) lipoprotein